MRLGFVEEGGVFHHAEEVVVASARDGLELGGLPAVDALGVSGGDGGFEFGAPDVGVGVLGDVELDDFGEDDGGGRGGEEVFFAPEVVGGFGFGADDVEAVFEVVAFLEAADGDLLFLEIAVEGGFAGDGGGELLGVGGGGGKEGAVGASDADVVDDDVLGGGGKGEAEDAPGLDGGLIADVDEAGDVARAGASAA
jgi:hypothetical protein